MLDQILAPLTTKSTRPLPVTFRRYILDEYLPTKSRAWKRSTERTTEALLADHVLPAFGDRPIATISRRDLQGHLDALAARGLSRSVVARVRFQLAAIFRMAASDGVVALNPAEGLVIPKCKPAIEKRIVPTEVLARAEAALELRDRCIFRLAAFEGLRPGEICGLQLRDVTPDGLRIERRVYRGNLDSPKSHRSRRLVPLTSGTRALLEVYLQTLPSREPEAWLFPSESLKTPLDPGNVWRRRIGPALRAAGIEGVNYQVLRRTWVTRFAEAEQDPRVRAQIAGHGVDVHVNVYQQPDAEALKRAVRRFERRILQ